MVIVNLFKLLKLAYNNNKKPITINIFLTIILEIIHVIGLYYINETIGNLYHGIQNYQNQTIYNSLGLFTLIAFLLVIITGYAGYISNKLMFNFREGLTWYYFKNKDNINNINLIDQRVQEDFKRFGENITDISINIFRSMLKIPVFIFVIAKLTRWDIGLGVFILIILGTWISRKVSLMLVPLQSVQENNEAYFRKDLSVLNFEIIRKQFFLINKMFKRLSYTQSGLGQLFVLLPFMIFLPLYLAKSIDFGQFYQAVRALGEIIDSLKVLIDSRQTLINIEMVNIRLDFLINKKHE